MLRGGLSEIEEESSFSDGGALIDTCVDDRVVRF